MTPQEAIDALRSVAEYVGSQKRYDAAMNAIRTIEQHIDTQPRMMLGRDVPTDGYYWIPGRQCAEMLLRISGRVCFYDGPSLIPVTNEQVYGPLPGSGESC